MGNDSLDRHYCFEGGTLDRGDRPTLPLVQDLD
jgi:hypothetical protein